MKPIVISQRTARRFVLGRQGLWPGRRWRGKKGVVQALHECETAQLDPLQATARSQDILLHSRVLDYRPEFLDRLMYGERKFFDYGGWLTVYPMTELPYWRVHMERRSRDKQVEDFTFENLDLFERVRGELRTRGPIGNRDLDGNAVAANYRGRKDTSLALYDMWISGEVMIHHREGFSRVYDFRENIAPPELNYVANEREAEAYFARKCIAFKGLIPGFRWKTDLEYYVRRPIGRDEMRSWRERWMEDGVIAPLEVEALPGSFLILCSDLPLIETLEAGKIPRTWRPLETTTSEEVSLLAPLDVTLARGRLQALFNFEYLWEVYKPAHQRRWGYYTLPILYRDELVARLDPKLDRATTTLQIKGFWHERPLILKDDAFLSALQKGLIQFAAFLGANAINLSGIRQTGLRRELQKGLSSSLSISTKSIL